MSTPVPPILKELHRLRRHLRDLQNEIDRGPRVLKMRDDQLAAEQQRHKDAYETIKRLKVKQKDDEVSLKQTEQQLAKFQADLNMAGSKKEFDAKQHEIEMATARKGSLEDAILSTITEIEERTADLPNVEKRWADAQAEYQQFLQDARDRLERMKADQAASQSLLAETEDRLPPEVRPLYDRLVKSFGPEALAGITGRTCSHCRMSITEQQRNNLLGGGFVCCPQCARGLYLAD
jgi:predicted  nucleic acid-binding Zn-ribbon protein